MASLKKFHLTILSLLLFGPLFAQVEICDNGIDDDGDGLIDCFDNNSTIGTACSGSSDCDSFYFGNAVECTDSTNANTFNIDLKWASPNKSAHNKSSVAIGDLDNDGTPEVVVTNHENNTLNVIDGATGSWLYSVNVGFNIGAGVAIANVEDDDCAEIFIYQQKSSRLEAWNCDLTTRLWTANSGFGRAHVPSLADFNQDGYPELYHGNEILDPMTGAKIVNGTGDWRTETSGGSVAVDIFPDSYCADCSGLELVDGKFVYAINITAGTKTLLKDMDDYLTGGSWYPKIAYSRNFTMGSVADYNLDGNLDLLIPGAFGSGNSGTSSIFFWDIVNDNVIRYADPQNNFTRGSGRINIADMDGDGNLNASFVSNQYLYCLNEDMSLRWRKSIKEGSSGFTGCSVFDFNGDGIFEVVYRSESTLHIIDGDDGTSRKTIYCQSRTWYEYPQVADVDGDGASELVVTCSTDDSLPFDPYSGSVNSQVRVYAAADGEVWQPSRSVWNQHGYFNVNVNDDLTIPIQQQDHSIALADLDNCTSLVTDKPLNNYLNQAPLLNEFGCPEFATPDISLTGPVTVTASQCPETEFEVSFTIENTGDQDLSGALPFTFYASDILDNSDDYIPAGERLNTEFEIVSDFLPGETLDITMTVIGPGGDFYLYVVVNDAGSNDPPFSISSESSITECDLSNNKGVATATYVPFTLSREKLKDNEKCDPSLPDNGRARAYFSGTIPGITEVVWLEDFDDLSGGEQSDAGETAWSLSFSGNSNKAHVDDDFGGLAFVVNNSDAVATWTSETIDISSYDAVDISVDMFSSGDLETSADYLEIYYRIDGGSFTLLTNGRQLGNFGYFQALADDLSGSTLTLQAKAYNTSNDEYYYFDNIRVEGDTPPQTGEFTDGFTFNWYNTGDYSTILYTGDTYASMEEGTYDVVGLYNSSNCYSDTLSVTINLDEDPDIALVLYETNPVTNCTPPNGELTAGVVEGTDTVTAGYSFEWYIGESNNPDDFIGTGSVAGSLSARLYQVIVTDLTTGCSVSASTTPSTSQLTPTLNLVSTTDITDCSDLTGGSATVASPDDVTFEWYDGSSVKATPDETGNTYNDLAAGTYTVIAVDNGSNCTSAPLQVVIENLTGAPNITTNVDANNSSCGDGNGQISAEASATSGNPTFTYEFFEGNSTANNKRLPGSVSGAFMVNDSTVGGLPAGDYTVRVTNDDDNCNDTQLITVIDEIEDVTFDPAFAELMARSACQGSGADPNNGSITVNQAGVDGGSGNYTYILYQGNSASGQPLETITSSELTGNFAVFDTLNSGNYTLLIVDEDTECESDDLLLQIPLERDEPQVTDVITTADNSCSTTFGLGTASLTSDSERPPYTYGYEVNIYEGSNTNSSNLIESDTIIPLVSSSPINLYYDSLREGTYRVEIINIENNCTTETDIVIDDEPEIVTIPIDDNYVIDNSSCDPANPLGFASVQMSNNSDYTFRWYDGSLVDEANRRPEDTNSIDSLAAGDYTVVAVSNDTECISGSATLTVGDDPFTFTVDIDEIQPSSGCGVSAGNGELEAFAIDPDTGDPLQENGGYTFQWYLGSDTSTPVAAQDSSFASGLTGLQEYTVEATSTSTGCTATASFTVTQDIIRPVLSLDDMTQNTVCDTTGTGNQYDGEVSVAVSFNGSSDDVSNYTYTWYEGSTTSDPVISGEITFELVGYPEGFYTVTAVGANGCDSDPVTVEITDNPNIPDMDLDATRTNNNTVCDTTTNVTGMYNGQISIVPVSGAVSDYTFTWYAGQSTDVADLATTVYPDATATVTSTNAELSNIEGGIYTVVYVSTVNGCTNTEEFEIIDDTAIPVIDYDNSEINNNTVCSDPGNGSIIAALDLSGTTINGVENDEIWQGISTCNSVILDDASAVGDNGFQLTTATNNQFGRIWLGDTLDLSQPLRFDFELYLGTKDVTGADGIAFTMHQDPRGYDARGRVGGNLGVGDAASSSGSESKITPAITVEFDTYQNTDVGDPTYDHTNLFLNGDVDVQETPPVQIVDGLDNVENGDTLQVTLVVRQVGGEQNLQVWVEGSMRLEFQMDYINDVFGGNPNVIAGFTSSTGGSNNDQAVFLKPYFDNFEFEWWDGAGVDPANLRSETDPFLCNLSDGQYTLRVTDNSTGCVSAIQVFDVDDDSENPILTASEVAPATVCPGGLDPDGSVAVEIDNFVGDSTDYTFAWYAGNSASGPVLSDNDTLVGQEAGFFTVLVTDISGDGDGCSTTATVEITEDVPVITFTGTPVDATNCAALDNGTYTVNTISSGVIGDYTYTVYDNLANTVGSNSTGVFADLEVGTYSIIALNNTTNCESAAVNFDIGTDTENPDVALITSDNSSCIDGSENGSITVDFNTDPGNTDYTFTWYVSTVGNVGVPGSSTLLTTGSNYNNGTVEVRDSTLTGAYTGNKLEDLDANIAGDTYWVRISDSSDPYSTCYTDLSYIVIDDPNEITIDATPVGATDCDPRNGSVTIDQVTETNNASSPFTGVGITSNFTIELYKFNTSTSTWDEQVGAFTGVTASALDTGDYYISAINGLGCASTNFNFTIGFTDNSPTVSGVAGNNDVCLGATAPSGTIDLTINGGTAAGDFDFVYEYDLADGSGYETLTTTVATSEGWTPTINATTGAASGLMHGDYRVTVTDNTTPGIGCSTIYTIAVGQDTPPVITNPGFTLTDATNCAVLDNGIYVVTSVEEDASVVAAVTDYTYELYDGSAALIATNTTGYFDNLSVDDYTLSITRTSSQCSGSVTFEIVDDSENPDVSIDLVNNSSCNGNENGELTVLFNTNPGNADYTFTWYVSTIANVGNPGSSTVITDGLNYNSGVIDLRDSTISANAFTENKIASLPANISGETYWVRVRDIGNPDSTCFTDLDQIVIDDPNEITVDATPTEATDCSPRNGTVTINQVTETNNAGSPFTGAGITSNFTIELYKYNTSTSTWDEQVSAFTGVTASALDTGDYYISAINDLGCTSTNFNFTIGFTDNSPTVSGVAGNNDVCLGATAPTGTIDLTVNGGPAAGDFDFVYEYDLADGSGYETITTATATSEGWTPTIDANTGAASGLMHGDYRVTVTDNTTPGIGCSTIYTISVGQDAPPTITVTGFNLDDATNCAVLDNGAYEVTQVRENGVVVATVGDYTYDLYDGSASIVGSNTTGLFSDLSVDDYTLYVTRTSSQCSGSVTFDIADDSSNPDVSIDLINNTSCNGNENGELTALFNADPGNTDYSFTWYVSTLANVGNPGSSTLITDGLNYNSGVIDIRDSTISGNAFTGNKLAALPANIGGETYWVRVRDVSNPDSTCFTDLSEIVIDDPNVITVTASVTSDVNQCSPLNGEITVTNVAETNNVSSPFTGGDISANFTLELYKYNGSTWDLIPSAFTGEVASGLDSGEYYVQVINDLDCDGVSGQLDIDDVTPTPSVFDVDGSNNTSCATPNGSVTITTFTWTGGAVDYQWYFGTIAGGGTALVQGADPGNGSDPSDPTLATVTGLAEGTYYVEVSDADGGSGDGCTYTQEVSIVDDPALVVATGPGTGTDNTGCTMGFDGSYTVTSVTTDGAGTFPTDYFFDWYTSGGSFIERTDGTAGGETKSDFDGGNYYVVAIDKTTECESASIPFTIGETITRPTLNASTIVNVERCDISIANGSITLDQINGFATPVADISIAWFSGGIATISVGGGTDLGVAGETLDNRNPGVYSARITNDLTGCFRDYEFTIGSDTPDSPTLTVTNTVQNSACSPTPNGELTGAGLLGGTVAADYTWYWFLEDKSTDVTTIGAVVSADGDVVTQLPDGTYYTVIENNNTGCVSDTVETDVIRDPASIFSIVEDITLEPGDCFSQSGAFTLEISDGAGSDPVDVLIINEALDTIEVLGVNINGGDYEILVSGLDTTAASQTYVDHLVANNGEFDFINGSYTVVVTDASGTTGCSTSYSFFLPYEEAPRLDIAVPTVTAHSYNCQPYEGTAITPGDNRDGTTGGQGGATGEVSVTLTLIDGLLVGSNHGDYQIFLYQGANPIPEPDMQIDDGLWNTGAGGRPTDIQVVEGIDVAVPTDEGEGVAGANDFEQTYTFSGLTAGTYTIMAAQENIAFCLSPSVTFEIEDAFDEFEITENDVAHLEILDNTSCTGDPADANGSIEIIQIQRILLDMAGADSIATGTDAQAGDYEFVWYEGTTTTPGTEIPTNALTTASLSKNNSMLSGLPAGSYTVNIIGKFGSGTSGESCTQIYTFEVTDNPDDIGIINPPSVTNNDNCDNPYDGIIDMSAVTFDVTDRDGATTNVAWGTAGYFAHLYEDGTGDLATTTVETQGINYLTPSDDEFTQVQNGDYQIIISNDPEGCSGQAFEITVGDDRTNPVLAVNTANNNTNCLNDPDGTITIDLTGDAGDYTVEWFIGGVSSTTDFIDPTDGDESIVAGATSQLTIDNIAGGTYTVKVTDNTTSEGCESFLTVVIEDEVDIVTEFTFDITDKTNCSPDNGTFTLTGVSTTNAVTNITMDSVSSNAADATAMDDTFIINIFNSDGSGPVYTEGPDAGDNLTISGMAPGSYIAQLENPSNSCFSVTRSFTIGLDRTNPTVSITGFSENTVCDTENIAPNGSIEATAAGSGGDFEFEWFYGDMGDDSTPIDDVTDVLPNNSGLIGDIGLAGLTGGTVSTISNLAQGTYWVRITDNTDPDQNCRSSVAYNLGSDITTYAIATATPSPLTNCDNTYDGSITISQISIDGTPTGNATFGDYQFTLTDLETSAVTGPTVGTNGVDFEFNLLDSGAYLVTVERVATGCASGSTQVNVGFDSNDPDLAAVDITADYSCNSGTGYARITATDGTGALDEDDFTFTWYAGIGEDPGNEIGGANLAGDATIGTSTAPVGGDEMNGLEAGTYTVFVTTNDGTGLGETCVGQVIFEIPEDPNVITLTVNPTDSRDCSPDNGSVSITQVDIDQLGAVTPYTNPTTELQTAAGNFTYTLFESNGTTDTGETFSFAGVNPNDSVFVADLLPGTYYVQATEVATGCSSSLTQIIIEDVATKPTVEITLNQGNTVCDITSIASDGEIVATVTSGDLDGNYTFQWYLGSVGDTSEEIFDGTTLSNGSGFGNTVSIDNSVNNESTLSGLVEDTYWVRVTDNSPDNTSCAANDEFIVPAATNSYAVVTATPSPLTNCDNTYDGSITISQISINGTPTGNATFGDYQFTLTDLETSAVTGPTAGTNGVDFEFNLLDSGAYLVTVEHVATGCTSGSRQVNVGFDSNDPDLAAVDITADYSCNSGTGYARITATDGTGALDEDDFTFTWYAGIGEDPGNEIGGANLAGDATIGTSTAPVGGDEMNGLEAGTYTVFVTTNDGTGLGETCVGQVIFEIPEDPNVITLTVNPTDSRDCSPDNGSVSITQVDIDQLGAVTPYTNPTTELQTAAGNFTYTLFESNGTTDTGETFSFAGVNPNDSVFVADLLPGTYYVQATEVATGCSSSLTQIIIEDVATKPTVEITLNQGNTVCDITSIASDGEIVATVTSGDLDGNYTFQWYLGSVGDTSEEIFDGTTLSNGSGFGNTVSIDNSVNNESTLSGLVEDTYWVRVTDNSPDNTSCAANDEFIVPAATNTYAVLTATASDIENCDDIDDAVITISDISENGSSIGGNATFGNYQFTLRDLETNAVTGPTVGINGVDFEFNSLDSGTYLVSIENIATGCASGAFQVNVDYNPELPVFDTPVLTADYFCTGGNGTATINMISPSVDPNDYEFTWYEGKTTSGTPYDVTTVGNNSQTGLESGFYTVFVEATGTANGIGCSGQIIIEIDDDAYNITFTGTANDVTECTDNGSIEITQITYDATSTTPTNITGIGGTGFLDDADLTYRLYSDAALTDELDAVVGSSLTDNTVFSPLTPGTYFVTVEYTGGNIAPGCASPAVQFEILDETTSPQVVITSTDNTFCDPDGTTFAADGTLTATVNNDDGGTYSYNWYYGDPTTGTLITAGADLGNGSDAADVDQATITGLGAGSYYVVVTDLDPTSSDCEGVATFVLENDPVDIDLTIDTITPDTACTSNTGAFTINDAITTRLSVVTASTYEYEYYDSTFASLGTFTIGVDEPTGLAAGTYWVTAYDETYNCTSNFVKVIIEEDLSFPQVELTATVRNTNCVDPNGSLTISATTSGSVSAAGYTFNWFDGSDTSTPHSGNGISSGTPVSINILDSLDEGTYTVEITDNATGCTVIQSYFLDDDIVTPILVIPSTQITADENCSGTDTGEIIITDADITPGNVSEYSITVRFGSATGTEITGSPFVGAASPLTLSNLDGGEYFITVTDTSTLCVSAVENVTVPDNTVTPTLTFETEPNIGCGITSNGTITITSIDSATVFTDYTYQWYDGSDTTAVEVADADGGNTNEITNQNEGIYTVYVENIATGCFRIQNVELTNEQVLPIIAEVDIQDVTDCNGNGSAEVVSILYNNVEVDPATYASDYTFTWYTVDNNGISAVIAGETLPSISDRTAGSFMVEILKNDDDCMSDPFDFIIEDEPVFPELLVTLVAADSSCTGGTPTGAVSATADGETETTDTNLTFTWYDDQNDVVSNSSTATGLSAGTYTAEVYNDSTGCTITQDIDVPLRNVTPDMELTVSPLTTCEPIDASIVVTSVTYGVITDYIYSLYTSDPSNGVDPVMTVTDGVMDSLDAGIYYVIAQNVNTLCETGTFEVEIEDLTNPPTITLDDFSVSTMCDGATEYDGMLSVLANGSSDPALYSFVWLNENMDTVSTTSVVTDVMHGDYTVYVTDLANGCTTNATFNIPQEPVEIILNVTAENNTYCDDPNGRVAVSIFPTSQGEPYDIFWVNQADLVIFDGIEAQNSTTSWTGLPEEDHFPFPTAGIYPYSVFVYDPNTNCYSDVEEVFIKDDFIFPALDTAIVPVTNCDLSNPNGSLTFSDPEDEIFKYRIDWFTGNVSVDEIEAGDVTPFHTGLSLDSMESFDGHGTAYSVYVTNVITGCSELISVEIPFTPEPVPAPSASVIANRTYCSMPNGVARASVSGNTDDYIFTWYEEVNGNVDLTDTVAVGPTAGGLDATTYVVYAQEIETGCVSPASAVTLFEELEEPTINVVVVRNTCIKEPNSLEEFSGQAFLSVTNALSSDTIIWFQDVPEGYQLNGNEIPGDLTPVVSSIFDSDSTVTSTTIGNPNNFAWNTASPGTHGVYFRAESGCATFATFTISTDIVVYNGISANGDSKNDIFLIDCIEYFPNNTVTIFDRAGAKVYEVEGYDNEEVYFDGQSNTGANFGNSNLPEGDYWYIIDKGDGSQQLQGNLYFTRGTDPGIR